MPDERGLYEKYHVERTDGRPIGPHGCIVLEFDDPRAWPALRAWVATMRDEGRSMLAAQVVDRVNRVKLDRYYAADASSDTPPETTDA